VGTKLTTLALCCALAACTTAPTRQDAALFATAKVVTDFESYKLNRVGLLPLLHDDLLAEQSAPIQAGFLAEFSRSTPFEVVCLDNEDLAEIPGSDPYRRGWYDPRTIIALSRRYQLDAVFVGTLADTQFFAPQRISVQVDLVACETGASIWTGAVHLDASDSSVRESLMMWREDSSSDAYRGSEPNDLALISPRRFARFAAWQLAQLL
jgi:hypothetical protein